MTGYSGATGATSMAMTSSPGSVRAVEEYLAEILKTLDHAILMIHEIDAH